MAAEADGEAGEPFTAEEQDELRHGRWFKPNDREDLQKLRVQAAETIAAGEADHERQCAEQAADEQKAIAKLKDDGNAAFKAGRLSDAVKLYSLAIEQDFSLQEPDEKFTAVLYANRAAAKIKQAENGTYNAFADAERDCQRAREREPREAKYLVRHAKCYEGLNRLREAFDCLVDALVLDPASSAVRDAITALRKKHGHLGTANIHAMQKLHKRAAAAKAKEAFRLETACKEAVTLLIQTSMPEAEPNDKI